MDSIYLVVALGAIVAGFVQGLSGFAFGLVALSFWAWVLDPKLAATLSVFGALTGQLLAAFTVRRGFNLKTLLPFVMGGLAGIPLGVYLLPMLDMNWLKAILGTLLVLWCPAMLLSRQLPRVTAGGRAADGVVGFAGGIMGGLGGFTALNATTGAHIERDGAKWHDYAGRPDFSGRHLLRWPTAGRRLSSTKLS